MCKLPDGTYKFSLMEMMNSGKNGMTSATGAIGTITTLSILLIFIIVSVYYLCMDKDSYQNLELLRLKKDGVMDILEYCTIWFGMGSALLGIRRVSGAIGSKNTTSCETKTLKKAEAINSINDQETTYNADVSYDKNETLEFNKKFSKKQQMFFEQAENKA